MQWKVERLALKTLGPPYSPIRIQGILQEAVENAETYGRDGDR